MKEIVLYDGGGTPSPRRVKMCLIEKGLSFKIKWLNLALMDQKAPSYLKLNPMGLVPTLVHDGKTIFESNVINEYIEAQSPNPPLVPRRPNPLCRSRPDNGPDPPPGIRWRCADLRPTLRYEGRSGTSRSNDLRGQWRPLQRLLSAAAHRTICDAATALIVESRSFAPD
jgi:hypothetical protein